MLFKGSGLRACALSISLTGNTRPPRDLDRESFSGARCTSRGKFFGVDEAEGRYLPPFFFVSPSLCVMMKPAGTWEQDTPRANYTFGGNVLLHRFAPASVRNRERERERERACLLLASPAFHEE